MLANGTLLGYKEHGKEVNYKNLEGLKTIPDVAENPEFVENTPIAAANKRYEVGIGDPGQLEYTFVYDRNTPDSSYRILRAFSTSREPVDFQEIWPDGTKFQYTAIPVVSITRGGGINSIVDTKVVMAVQSDIEIIDPVQE